MQGQLRTLLVHVFCAAAAMAGPSHAKRHTSAALGVSFPLPAAWRVSACSEPGCLQLTPGRTKKPAAESPVTIQIKAGSLEDVLRSEGFTTDASGAWIREGRGRSTTKAVAIRTGACTGYYAITECGFSDGLGMHTGECLTAVLAEGSRCAVIETDGTADTGLVRTTVLEGFRFLK